MPAVKLLNESYRGEHTLAHVVNYVLRSGDVGGLAVDPAHAVSQMLLTKHLWRKTEGRQVRHFIVAFSEDEDPSPDALRTYAYRIASYYAERYQIVFGIHHDTLNPHIHFAFNSVSYIDGQMYSGGLSDYIQLKQHIQSLMPNWSVVGVT